MSQIMKETGTAYETAAAIGQNNGQEMNHMEQSTMTWKWHNFLTHFGLYAIAIMNGLSALGLICLSVCGLAKGVAVPIIGSVLVTMFAFGSISDLRNKKKNGVEMLLFIYWINIAVGVLMILFNPGDAATCLGNAAISAGMLAANKRYYNKRMSYFVN